LKLLLAAALLAAAPAFAQERLLDPAAPDSASHTARVVLKHLAEGDLEQAAALSNAPQQRLAILRAYLNSVGEEKFRSLFGELLTTQLVAEVALGPRRLLIWEVGGADLTGQYYIQVDGKYLMDDVPSAERTQLARVLQRFRPRTN
jgi:hypothetical protein